MESIEERKNREEAEKRAIEEKRTDKKLNKLATETALVSGEANRFISEAFVKQKAGFAASSKDKNFSRRVLREVKRYESTGRTSSWLASEFTKAQALRETTSKRAQEQPESVPLSSVGTTIPIPNAPTGYEFEPIKFEGGSGGGGGETPAHPWKITIRTTPNSDPPTYQYAIESGSRLFNGFGGNEVGVSGADGIFRNLEEGYYFIEVIFSNNIVGNAQIKTGTNLGNIIETSGDPPKQTKLRQQIGYVFFEDGVPQLRQNAWHNYTLFDICRNGVPVKVTIAT